jgi:hypothetical protein
MKVIVYDLSQLVTQTTGEPYCGIEWKNALIVGPDKVILTDTEGCHSIHGKDEYVHVTSFVTKQIVAIPIEKMINRSYAVPVDEVELRIFVRTFGDRIENNYRLLLKSIKEIGLNPDDYPRNPK